MATEELIKPLREAIEAALAYKSSGLVKRTEKWGTITFERAERDFERFFGVVGYLALLPLENLTDSAVATIAQHTTEVTNVLKKIDTFSLDQSNPPQVRETLVNQIHAAVDQFYSSATPWIPFLAYQRGDVETNIEALTTAVTEAKGIVTSARDDIEKKQGEIRTIIANAREASAGAGAAVFTHDFLNEALKQSGAAKSWLIATGVLAVATIAAAFVMWLFAEVGLDSGVLIQKAGSKLVVLLVLSAATLWCGRIYRALMHQSATNKHRALGLQTFQAFSSAASDAATKDAVLLATTRSIFDTSSTGYLDAKSDAHVSDVRVIEIAKSPVVAKVAEGVAK